MPVRRRARSRACPRRRPSRAPRRRRSGRRSPSLDQRTPRTASAPATNPITIAAQGATNPAGRRDCDERRDHAVQEHREVRLLDHEPRREDAAECSCGGRDVRGQRDVGEVADVLAASRCRGSSPALKPNQPNQRIRTPSVDVGHVVAGNRVRLPVRAVLAEPRSEQERAGERRERALVVDDRRACEVLHPAREQPAVRVPDPVGDDRVDQREDDAEREVDPELRPLGHRPPDDRERDAGEDGLEEVAAPAGTVANQENGAAPTASRSSTLGTNPEPPRSPLPPSPNAIPKPTR